MSSISMITLTLIFCCQDADKALVSPTVSAERLNIISRPYQLLRFHGNTGLELLVVVLQWCRTKNQINNYLQNISKFKI